MVCGREWLGELSQTLVVVGAVTGGVVLSMMADRVGRKPVILVSALALGVTGIITAYSTSYIMFAICRYFVGVFYSVSTCERTATGLTTEPTKRLT